VFLVVSFWLPQPCVLGAFFLSPQPFFEQRWTSHSGFRSVALRNLCPRYGCPGGTQLCNHMGLKSWENSQSRWLTMIFTKIPWILGLYHGCVASVASRLHGDFKGWADCLLVSRTGSLLRNCPSVRTAIAKTSGGEDSWIVVSLLVIVLCETLCSRPLSHDESETTVPWFLVVPQQLCFRYLWRLVATMRSQGLSSADGFVKIS